MFSVNVASRDFSLQKKNNASFTGTLFMLQVIRLVCVKEMSMFRSFAIARFLISSETGKSVTDMSTSSE